MGTSIELAIGSVDLSYAKNHMGIDWGYLFQDGDYSPKQLHCIDDDEFTSIRDASDVEREEGFYRTLRRMLPRLTLLGHTLQNARAEYEQVLADVSSTLAWISPEQAEADFMDFEEFCTIACRHPISSFNTEYIEHDANGSDASRQGRFALELDDYYRLPSPENPDFYWSESSFFQNRICMLSPESMLLIFGLNKQNLDEKVSWNFGPLVEAGWATKDDFRPNARRRQTVLVATEGASDAKIVKRALELLCPDVIDFFRFIDENERHHFWGTGNLVKFAEGLMRIDIQNKVLFLLDNDAEGVDAYRKLEALKFPGNMRMMLLPELNEFRSFPALGPEGLVNCDINGRAAAIECYLDLHLKGRPAAQITWSNYKKEIDAWHGSLDFKETYIKHFMKLKPEKIISSGYDTSKLSILVDNITQEAALIKETSW